MTDPTPDCRAPSNAGRHRRACGLHGPTWTTKQRAAADLADTHKPVQCAAGSWHVLVRAQPIYCCVC